MSTRRWKSRLSFDDLIPTDLAYLAGFTDADGSIGLYKQSTGNFYQPRLTLGNTSKSVFKWIKSKLGDCLTLSSFQPRKESAKCFVLVVTRTAEVHDILKHLIPYLVIKKEQAQLLIDYIDGKVLAQEASDRLRKLKRIST